MWNNDKVANPTLPCPENVGWTADENGWVPVMTKLRTPPAPDAITYPVRRDGIAQQTTADVEKLS